MQYSPLERGDLDITFLFENKKFSESISPLERGLRGVLR